MVGRGQTALPGNQVQAAVDHPLRTVLGVRSSRGLYRRQRSCQFAGDDVSGPRRGNSFPTRPGGRRAAAFRAGQQVRESERSRNAEMATHMFDQWGRAELAGARDADHNVGGAETRRAYNVAWDGGGAEDEQKIRKAADAIMIFFEELGVMELEGGTGRCRRP